MGFWSALRDTFNTRAYDAPERVYVENDGPAREIFTEPPSFIDRFYELLNGYYGAQNYLTLFYSLPEIYAPIHEIASRVADANWQLVKDWNNEVDYKDEAFNRLFTQPNPLLSHRMFIYQAVCYELLTGRQFFYANVPRTIAQPDYRDIVTLWNLPADKVKVDMKTGIDIYSATTLADLVQQYVVPQAYGGDRVFTPTNVWPIVHFSFANPNNFNAPNAPIMGADKAIRNLLPVYEARGAIYLKRGKLGMWVNRGKDANGPMLMTDEQKLEIARNEAKDYGITGGKTPVGYTTADVDFIRTSMSIQELQPFEETLADAIAIYATLRVPRHLVPSKDRSTYANADADMKAFYQDVIIPMAEKYAQIFTNGMGLKAFRRYVKPNYEHIGVLQNNRSEASKADSMDGATWLQRWQNGACSLNEWIIAFDGTKGVGPVYEKKLFEMTPDEVAQVQKIIAPQKQPVQTAQTRGWEEQPRVPAGAPDGGQWAGGDNPGGVGATKEKTFTSANLFHRYNDGKGNVKDKKVGADTHKLAALTGLPSNYAGDIGIIEYKDTGEIYVNASGDGVDMERILHPKTGLIENEHFRIQEDSKYKGQGAHIFAAQVKEAVDSEYKTIRTLAAQSGQLNGYYTWARLGYKPDVQGKQIEKTINSFNEKYKTNANSLEELIGTKTGQAHWRENGSGFYGTFDLSEGSYSRNTLKNYIDGKGK